MPDHEEAAVGGGLPGALGQQIKSEVRLRGGALAMASGPHNAAGDAGHSHCIPVERRSSGKGPN